VALCDATSPQFDSQLATRSSATAGLNTLERARAEEGLQQAMYLGNLTSAAVAWVRRTFGARS
jgi:hypothetical protein